MQLDSSMPKELVIQSFKMAVGSIDRLCNKFNFVLNNKLLVHQDRGSQYTSHGYVDIVLKHDFRLSYSAPGTQHTMLGKNRFLVGSNKNGLMKFMSLKLLRRFKHLSKIRYNITHMREFILVGYKPPYVYTKKFLTDTS